MSIEKHVIIVGAGIGGLATALRLRAAGLKVTVFEAASAPGGKMRAIPTEAGPADAGPTVLTMKWVFEDLFRAAGTALEDHVTLVADPILARHFWSDGTQLDLMADKAASAENVAAVFGSAAAQEFRAFSDRAARLFNAFDAPMMRSANPSALSLAGAVMRSPGLTFDMAPGQTLAQALGRSFRDPKLRQLFGRYATYVGGSPYDSPALLSLIWHAENSGVWSVQGGMHALARAIARLLKAQGAEIYYDTAVTGIACGTDGTFITTTHGQHHADAIVFNGDPRALTTGSMGEPLSGAVPAHATAPRSLSADVMTFAAQPAGPELVHHNVFFGEDPKDEFDPIARGKNPNDPTLYVCAQDRGGGARPTGPERLEIIMNAPPCTPGETLSTERANTCQTRILNRLEHMGLSFSPRPGIEWLTQPVQFNHLFPDSLGSLYGRSPHGMTAGLKRPGARTTRPGLYLAGGGAHPGAGVPMATLSGQHAAEAICTDLGLTLPSRQTATRGGMSTDSLTAAPALSRSSRS